MISLFNVLKLFIAFDFDCSFSLSNSLGVMLDIIAFLLCLAREECSFLRLLLLVSNLDVPLKNNSSSHTQVLERSGDLDFLNLPSSESSQDHSRSSWMWRSGRISVCFPSFRASAFCTFAASASAFFALHYQLDSYRFLVSFRSLKDQISFRSQQKRRRYWQPTISCAAT